MDLVPTTSAANSSAKRPRTKSVGKESIGKESAATPKPKRKTLTAGRKDKVEDVAMTEATQPAPPLDVRSMIEIEAFYLAAARGFAPGQELDDWLEAERRIRAVHPV